MQKKTHFLSLFCAVLTSLVFVACENSSTSTLESVDQSAMIFKQNVQMNLDLEQSVLYWQGKKVVLGGHEGTLNFSFGQLMTNEQGMLSGGHFMMDMNSISATDLTGEDKEKLDNHLKSADFFDVSNYPAAHFTIQNVSPILEAGIYNYILQGEMEIKGIIKTVEIPVQISMGQDKMYIKSDFMINRVDFGVVFHSKSDTSFDFEKMKDWAIQDEIGIHLEMVAHLPQN